MWKRVEQFVLYGNLLLILLGFIINVWEPVAFGAVNILLFFGIPHLLDKVQDAVRRRK